MLALYSDGKEVIKVHKGKKVSLSLAAFLQWRGNDFFFSLKNAKKKQILQCHLTSLLSWLKMPLCMVFMIGWDVSCL